jgi:alcohol dehydrogenase (cytochrome c)
VNAQKGFSVFYLIDESAEPEGYGGTGQTLWSQPVLEAIDYKTGKLCWSHEFPGSGRVEAGILTTAGGLLFSGDQHGNLIAADAKSGAMLWHFHLPAPVSNGPMTFERDGTQYLIVGAGDTLYAFTATH